MIRVVVRTGVLVAANAVGLLVAASVLDQVTIDAGAFLLDVVIFTAVLALAQPFLISTLRRSGSAVLGGVALIATLASLIITDVVSDGLSISGAGTWLAATVIVWAAALVAAFVLPVFGLRKHLENR